MKVVPQTQNSRQINSIIYIPEIKTKLIIAKNNNYCLTYIKTQP